MNHMYLFFFFYLLSIYLSPPFSLPKLFQHCILFNKMDLDIRGCFGWKESPVKDNKKEQTDQAMHCLQAIYKTPQDET